MSGREWGRQHDHDPDHEPAQLPQPGETVRLAPSHPVVDWHAQTHPQPYRHYSPVQPDLAAHHHVPVSYMPPPQTALVESPYQCPTTASSQRYPFPVQHGYAPQIVLGAASQTYPQGYYPVQPHLHAPHHPEHMSPVPRLQHQVARPLVHGSTDQPPLPPVRPLIDGRDPLVQTLHQHRPQDHLQDREVQQHRPQLQRQHHQLPEPTMYAHQLHMQQQSQPHRQAHHPASAILIPMPPRPFYSQHPGGPPKMCAEAQTMANSAHAAMSPGFRRDQDREQVTLNRLHGHHEIGRPLDPHPHHQAPHMPLLPQVSQQQQLSMHTISQAGQVQQTPTTVPGDQQPHMNGTRMTDGPADLSLQAVPSLQAHRHSQPHGQWHSAPAQCVVQQGIPQPAYQMAGHMRPAMVPQMVYNGTPRYAYGTSGMGMQEYSEEGAMVVPGGSSRAAGGSSSGERVHYTATQAAPKKRRVQWTDELHNKFLEAVTQVGLDSAMPKMLLQIMDVTGLTRENVASHLQKYRLLQRKNKRKALEENADNTARVQRSKGDGTDIPETGTRTGGGKPGASSERVPDGEQVGDGKGKAPESTKNSDVSVDTKEKKTDGES